MPTNLEQLRAQHPHLSDDMIADLAAVTLQIGQHKDTRPGLLGLIKKQNPNAVIPELDTAHAVEERFAKEKDAREKFESEQRDRWLKEDLARQKTDVRQKFGLSDEDMAKMEKMMTDKQLPADYNWAAPLYKQQTENTTPTNYGSSGYGPLDLHKATEAKEFDGLMSDPDNWASRTAHSMIDDIQRKGRAPAF